MFGKKNNAVEQQVVLQTLSTVMDPDLNRNIVELGFVKNLQIRGGEVSFDVELTTPACPVKDMLRDECHQKVAALQGVDRVSVNMTAQVTSRKHESKMVMAGVKNVIAVASGKGGVGKSTCAVNLASALHATGASVGLMDADVYGPSIPMMLGIDERPEITQEQKIIPIDHHGLKVVSMGLLSDENTPIIWRGPMVSKLVQQFLGGVEWGELDYLIVDMPPGTGDAQLTLSQQAPLAGAVIVTTPQEVSLIDARKGLRMFEEVKVPVLGIIENMSYFNCGHCGERTEIFSHGGARKIAGELGVPFLGEIPLDPEVVVGGDEGQPIVVRNPDSPVSKAYTEVARNVAARVSIANAEAPAQANVSFAWDPGKKTSP